MKKFLLSSLFLGFLIFPFSHESYATPANAQAFSVVRILVFDAPIGFLEDVENAKAVSGGSGVIIGSYKNEVITNYHVLAEYIENPEKYSFLICLTYSYTEPPSCRFRGKVLKYNKYLDLAHIQITHGYTDEPGPDGKTGLAEYPTQFDIDPVYFSSINSPLNADGVQIGEKIFVYGFPGYGGSNITLTTGIVSGFDTMDVLGSSYTFFIKTDTKLNPGNSGGAVFDENNNFIGIPTLVVGGDGNIGYIMPIKTVEIFLGKQSGIINEGILTEVLQKKEEEYEAWKKKQCGENSFLTQKEGCQCEEGYEWENDDPDNMNCKKTIPKEGKEEEKKDEKKDEKKEQTGKLFSVEQCGTHSTLSQEGKCVCDEGFAIGKYGKCAKENDDYTPPEESSFSDVSTTHKNRTAIEYLKEKNILRGYEDGSFKPLKPVNRGELLKIIIEANPKNFDAAQYAKDCFLDVAADLWFTPYVCYAKEKGWVKRYEDGTFRPGQTVSKVEAIKIILEAYGFKIPERATESVFLDVDLGEWFSAYIQVANTFGFLEETSGTYEPYGGMRRSSVSETMYRVLRFEEKSALPEFTKFTSEDKSFSLEIPVEWSSATDPAELGMKAKTTSDDEKILFVALSPLQNENDLIQESLGVSFEKLSDVLTLDEYLKKVKEKEKNFYETVKVIREETIEIAGKQVKRLEYDFSPVGISLRTVIYIFLNNQDVYSLTFTAFSETIDEYYPTFEHIAESFQIEKS
ncbi:S-layer homology domain-containing protein [Candidatus Peregrinibacteria bacterium]|nr:S-layer homology domain-containing protein [Candidatus Peregrinibacteria bacterium]